MANDNDRSTLFTTRSTENAMTFFTVVGFLTLVVIFVYEIWQGTEKWYMAFTGVWESIPHVLSFATMLTIFKEGVDVMLTRLQEYRDRRKGKIAKEVEKQVAQQVEKIEKAAYQKGYEAAKSESRSREK